MDVLEAQSMDMNDFVKGMDGKYEIRMVENSWSLWTTLMQWLLIHYSRKI